MSFDRKRKLKKTVTPFCTQCGKGFVVRSRTGRTRGRLFVTVGAETDRKGKLFALVCDGVRYLPETPKRKSAAHLEAVTDTARELPGTARGIRELLDQYR